MIPEAIMIKIFFRLKPPPLVNIRNESHIQSTASMIRPMILEVFMSIVKIGIAKLTIISLTGLQGRIKNALDAHLQATCALFRSKKTDTHSRLRFPRLMRKILQNCLFPLPLAQAWQKLNPRVPK